MVVWLIFSHTQTNTFSAIKSISKFTEKNPKSVKTEENLRLQLLHRWRRTAETLIGELFCDKNKV